MAGICECETTGRPVYQGRHGPLFGLDESPETICPMTGSYCQGEWAHLCDDYGCARKVGLSPYSDDERLEWDT